ncbi:FkbM family methyltransferase [Mucilaginibacter aquaedulcis]|jgi:FkbM family methyltransferase|uniref:FkbM family methyltransferase n=1 Tax=Mucilaginibacter aquaedulcis TaxID=1187081 RepID=UPI0025B5A873|nr:FkbM family methyltransferase [Mucilaginibacter aquaedulcis]MDN3547601.1 FkbM family methyltransferase [Mucilaginibacter aquaedulcis]
MTQLFKKAFMAIAPSSVLLTSTVDEVKIQGYNKSGFGGRGVFLKGIDYEPELKYLKYLINEGSVLFDIGANSGVYSMMAAKLVGKKGTVVAVEPFPAMSAMLVKNSELNKFSNVRVRTFGASHKTEVRTFWLNDDKPNSFSFSIQHQDAKELSFLTVSLDDLFEWEKLDRLDYIKIDAEGEEDNILKGAEKVIAKYKPVIQVEITQRQPQSIPSDYRIFHIPGSDNHYYIPGSSDKIQIAIDQGWEIIK